jgi:hypothetical protein
MVLERHAEGYLMMTPWEWWLAMARINCAVAAEMIKFWSGLQDPPIHAEPPEAAGVGSASAGARQPALRVVDDA